jgi:DNA-binding transcriptional ArsR family regulator
VNTETATRIFAALGDPTRQHLLELLAEHGRASATTLAEPLGVSRQAVNKHLQVLERVGLIGSDRNGREVLYTVRRIELDRSAAWLRDRAQQWGDHLATLKAAAENPAHPVDRAGK